MLRVLHHPKLFNFRVWEDSGGFNAWLACPGLLVFWGVLSHVLLCVLCLLCRFVLISMLTLLISMLMMLTVMLIISTVRTMLLIIPCINNPMY